MHVQIIMPNPSDIKLKKGTHAIRELSIIDMNTVNATDFIFLATGSTIAINIPYKAIENADCNDGGSRALNDAPKNVPSVHPIKGVAIKPII